MSTFVQQYDNSSFKGMQVKEVRIGADTGADYRFVVWFTLDAAQRDQQVRQRLVAQLEEMIH